MQSENSKSSDRKTPWSAVLNLVRGFLIGVAEIIPGISGGTIALITGVYGKVIYSASEAVRGFLLLFTFSPSKWVQAGTRFRAMHWSLLVPLLLGMLAAIFVAAGVVEPLLENYPTLSKSLFAGLILASLVVPIRLSGGKWRTKEYLVAALAAAAAFAFTSIPKGVDQEPTFWLIVGSAAVAVCALVLPGVSGSYLLLALGMYSPTLQAVNDLNFAYLGSFVLGAILGLGAFVSLLEWLLEHKSRITLVVMTGLMVGSLRALWPWQSEAGELQAPDGGFVSELGMLLVGVLIIAGVSYLEHLAKNRSK